jgi:hypothetical protein
MFGPRLVRRTEADMHRKLIYSSSAAEARLRILPFVNGTRQ